MAKKYEDLAKNVVELVGGKENISSFIHCVTRLRFTVKDKSKVQDKEIEKFDDIIGINWAGNQFQIIVGQAVGDVYKMICDTNDLDGLVPVEKKEKSKFTINTIFDYIAGCIIPILPILLGTGMLKVLMTLMQYAGLLSVKSSTYAVLNFVTDAGFYFMPVFIGKAAAKKFGTNEALGMLLGAMMIHPTFVEGVAKGTSFNFFGLPIYGTSYTSSILPIILAVAIMAPIQRFIGKKTPEILRMIVEPTLTLLIMIPITLCIVGPIGAILGEYVASGIAWLNTNCSFLALGIVAAANPFFIMFGMHSALISLGINSFMTYGFEALVMPCNFISQMSQGAAALAVGIKSKDVRVKSTAISAATTALLGGVTEPAMYGINLKYKTPLYASMIGSGIAGIVAGLLKTICYVPGGSGIFYIPSFIGDKGISNVIFMCLAVVLGMVLTFVFTLVLYKEKEETEA